MSGDRLFFGKTKVMAKALGSSAEDEYLPNLRLLSEHLAGDVGLLFTHRAPADLIAFFAGYAPADYARAGTVASQTFVLPTGTVHSRGGEIATDEDVPLAHSFEPTLRALGVSSRLVKGRVELGSEHVVCRQGDVLDSKQTRLLKIFGLQTAEFRVRLLA